MAVFEKKTRIYGHKWPYTGDINVVLPNQLLMNHTRPYILAALLLDALEAEGWKIGTGQHLRLQEILRQLPPDTDDDALGLALAPLLARNAQEQALVYEKLEVCRRRADAMAAAMPAPESFEIADAERAMRKWYWRMWLLLGLILFGVPLWMWWTRQHTHPVTLRKELVVNAGQTASLCPSGFPLSDSLLGRAIDLRINFSKSITSKFQIEGDIRQQNGYSNSQKVGRNGVSNFGSFFIQKDTCLVYTANENIGQDSLVLDITYSDGKTAELQLRIFVSAPAPVERPDPKEQPGVAPLFSQIPLPHPHDILALKIEQPAPWIVDLARHWAWLRWVFAGLAVAAFVAAWNYWQQKRRKLIAELRSRDKPPYIWNIRIPGSDDIALGDNFAHLLQVLRRRASSDTWRLDLKATIAATAARGGMPEFRYRQQTRPVDYLLLIDRQSLYNHRAQLYDALYRAFREQEIEIERFFFDSDIRRCYNEAHPSGLRIAEIAQRYGDARLIVVGTGAQLISPITGQVESWAGVFKTWNESALFSPKPHGEWGRNEHRLAEYFSTVLPASLQSLAFWAEETEAGEDARFEEWRARVQDAPALFWQPDPEVPLPLLQMQFEPHIVKWIAACAIYPALHYDLTVWLGKMTPGQTPEQTLTTFQKLSKFALSKQQPDSSPATESALTTSEKLSKRNQATQPAVSSQINLSDLSAIFRIRWFVDGQIPQTARAALLDWLQAEDPEFLAATRLALADLLRQNPPPTDSAAHNDHALRVAITEWLATKDPKRRKELEKQIAQLLDAGAEADFVALKYLDKPRGPLDFVVPDAWKKYMHPGGKPALGNRLPMFAAVLAGLCIFGFFGNRWVSDWLYQQMNPCTGQTVEYTPRPGTSFDNFSKVVKTDPGQANNTTTPKQQQYTLCLDSPEDSLLWRERQALDLIDMGDFAKLDSLSQEPEPSRTDTLLGREVLENLNAAFYNKGVYFYEKNMRDSACYCFEKAEYFHKIPELGPALRWCGNPDTAAAPRIRLLGPIAITVQDAATRAPIPDAQVLAQGMRPGAVRRQGGRLTLTPPADWASPEVRLFVKAEGYQDSVFTLSVDGVRAFPTLNLRRATGASWPVGGVVRDADDNTPLAGVLVRAGGLQTLSDATGKFELRLPVNYDSEPTRYSVEFQMIGYETARRELQVELRKKPDDLRAILMKIKKIDEVGIVTNPDPGNGTDPAGNSPPAASFPIPEMLPVPGGSFTMGSNESDKDADDNEKPAHLVSLSIFEMGKYEVTIEQYLAFCDETKTHYPEWLEPGSNYNIETGSNDYYKTRGMSRENKSHPVTGVSWNDATAYCAWLSQKTGQKFRLPTEAEWEYAARGGQASQKDRFQYAGSNDIEAVAWYSSNSGGTTHPVGGKAKNQLGLFDMSGNVWEWCSDWYGSYSKLEARNPTGPSSGFVRVPRGGSWNDDPLFCRAAYRNSYTPDYRNGGIGFRLARTP